MLYILRQRRQSGMQRKIYSDYALQSLGNSLYVNINFRIQL